MRPVHWLSLLLILMPCQAWNTLPHRRITKAALDTLPRELLDRFGSETTPLIEVYCMYPDRYGDPRGTPPEISFYCVRPDGKPIHGITGEREVDLESLVFLLERFGTNLAARRPAEAARFAGVISHFIADSLSPPHSVGPERLRAMLPPEAAGIEPHATLERSLPEFTLGARIPRPAGKRLVAAARATLDGCYAGSAQNRKDLAAMLKLAGARDEQKLDVYRLRAGVRASEMLADVLDAVWKMIKTPR